MKPVTDPALLSQLDGGASEPKAVTDPALLAQLDGKTEPSAPARVAQRTDRTGNAIDQFILDKFGNTLSKAPDIQGSVVGRFIQGLADLPVGVMQLAANTLWGGQTGAGEAANSRIAEINRTTERQRGPDAGFDWARLAGNVANPIPWKAGAAIKAPPTLVGRAAQGTGVGGAFGATAPVTNDEEGYWGQKGVQTATGMALGFGIPAVTEGVSRTAKAIYQGLVEPRFGAGRKAIKSRTLLEAAGPRAPQVISELRKPGEIVPGSMPTAAEAAAGAGSAEFSALQKSASEVLPSEYVARESAQNAARARSVGTVAQDKPALAAAESARKAVTDPMYEAARSGGAADTSRVSSMIDTMLGKNPGNPELVTELRTIQRGVNASKDARQLSSVLDGIKTALAKEDNKFIRGQLTTIKEMIEEAIPGYRQAQQKFGEMSKPMNVMQIGQYLEGKLTPALNDFGASASQRAGTYAGALRDAPTTIKRSTGMPRYEDLSQILSPQEREAVESVARDLARRAEFERLAAAGSRSGENSARMASRQLEKQVGTDRLPNLLNRAAMMGNAVLRRINAHADEKLEKELAADLLSPKTTADLMEFAASRIVAKQLIDAWKSKLAPARVPAYGAAVQGAIAPPPEMAQ